MSKEEERARVQDEAGNERLKQSWEIKQRLRRNPREVPTQVLKFLLPKLMLSRLLLLQMTLPCRHLQTMLWLLHFLPALLLKSRLQMLLQVLRQPLQPAAAAAAPPFEEPSAAAHVEEPPQGAAAASSGSRPALVPRVVVASRGPNIHATPGILAELAPATCYKLRLSYNDHRFKAEVTSEAEQRRIAAKSFSRSFAANKATLWKNALVETHHWMWRHWLASPDAGRGHHQDPGEIPQTVLDTLGPIIEGMDEPKVYK